jgi:hypothetical protein
MGPGLVWQDLRRIVQGAFACLRYLRSRENIEIALGLFETASSVVVVGQPCRYLIHIANVSGKIWEVRLAVEVSPLAPQNHPAGHYAWFTKRITVPPHRTTRIEVDYDWLTKVDFMLGDVASPPDEFRKGEVDAPQLYAVSASLSDPAGNSLDKLTVYQELKG